MRAVTVHVYKHIHAQAHIHNKQSQSLTWPPDTDMVSQVGIPNDLHVSISCRLRWLYEGALHEFKPRDFLDRQIHEH